MDLLRIGTIVKVSDQVNPRFAGRPGKVVSLHFNGGYLEYGLSFGKSQTPDAWFLPKELHQFSELVKAKPVSEWDFPE